MLGEKVFVPKLFYQFSLEERVPPDHLLRRVAAAVDMAFVRRLTARFYSHTGRPGIDPVVLFKLALLGYLYGITSERRLAEEARLNLAFAWFLGYDLDEVPPNHSVLSKARTRFGVTVYQAFFTEIVRQCEQAGLIAGNLLYVDSTMVAANARLKSAAARTLVAQLADPAAYLDALWEDNPATASFPIEPSEPAELAAPTAPAAHSNQGAGCQLHLLSPMDTPNGPPGAVNTLVASRTDPDAGLVGRAGVPLGFYYKTHIGVDGGHARIITALDVTAGEVADEHLLSRLVNEHERTTGRAVAEVAADTKYGTHANYLLLEQAGIRASIPPHSKPDRRGAFAATAFHYDLAADRYLCPAGQSLIRQGSSRTAGATGGIIYRARPKVCGACPHKSDCCGEAAARTLTRPDDGGLGERVRQYLRTPHARHRLRCRSYWVETANAELKERHGLRRMRGRGQDPALMQALGAATAYNIKKLAQRCRPQVASPARGLHAPGLAPQHRTAELTRRHHFTARCIETARSGHRHAPFGNRPPCDVAA